MLSVAWYQFHECLDYAMSKQIQCHRTVGKDDEEEIGVCGRLSEQEPMGFPSMHGGGLHT
jgi:hypothetical protein